MNALSFACRRALPALVAAVVAVLPARPAQAYHLLTKGGACPAGFVFAADAPLSINIANTDSADSFSLVSAVEDVALRFNAVGGQTFDFTPLAITTDAFAIGDADGVNEIGLADLSGTGAGGMGPTIVDLNTCEIIEANVLLAMATDWRYEVPSFYGEDYFNSQSVSSGERYLREVIVHELGHNLSLAHSTDSYDFMNAGSSSTHARPWQNRADARRVEPLPDMRRALRNLYPGTAEERDIGALVTWYDDSTGDSPAPQKLLCSPSGGTAFSPSLFDDTCGVDAAGNPGSTTVCAGDSLYTRFAIPNYGNVDLGVTFELWFSADATLDRAAGSGDIASPRTVVDTIGASNSARRGIRFDVPAGLTPGATYYPIIFVNTGADYTLEESQDNNWIPLREAVTICP
jgi:hypothetical protein